jgi:hypothetical protein
MKPTSREHIATTCFALLAAWALLFRVSSWEIALPHAIFYTVLIVNTFFSIRFFTPLTPRSHYQTLVDGALVVIYAALALSIGWPIAFSFAALALFVVAPMKYTHKLELIPHTKLLRKKILIDLWGTVLCLAVLGGTILGYAPESAWALAIIFSLANVYLLFVKPMYRMPS